MSAGRWAILPGHIVHQVGWLMQKNWWQAQIDGWMRIQILLEFFSFFVLKMGKTLYKQEHQPLQEPNNYAVSSRKSDGTAVDLLLQN